MFECFFYDFYLNIDLNLSCLNFILFIFFVVVYLIILLIMSGLFVVFIVLVLYFYYYVDMNVLLSYLMNDV